MHHSAHPARVLKALRTAECFRTWLEQSAENLTDAADLLGGQKWVHVAQELIIAAQTTPDLTTILPRLRKFRRLLTLEFVNNLESEEAARFFTIDPDHPRADNARICADAFDIGIRSLEIVAPITKGAAA